MASESYYPDTLDGEAFQPYLDKGTVQGLIQHYKNDPEPFDEDKLKQVELHAQHYNLPFARTDTDQHGRVSGILQQAGAGFWSGFTTFNVGEEPRDEWEGIARNIGHLAGFVGFIPSIPRKLYKFLPKASKLKTMSEAMKKVQGKSIPMLGAKAIQDKVSPIAKKALAQAMVTRGGATATAAEFLNKGLVKDLIGGAFHLGVASSISSWQYGVDEMMRSFIGGAETGFVFRGIGNIVQTGSKVADTSIRMMASSAYTGLPSTLRGATTPEQVYEYLLGAYFGFKEMPYHRRDARTLIGKAVKDGKAGQPIELMPEFGEMDRTTQKTTIEMAEKIWGEVSEAGGITPITGNIMAYELMSKFGFNFEEAQGIAKEYMERGGTLTDIEPFLTKKMVDNIELTKAEKGSQEDLDMEVSTDSSSYMSVQQKVVNYIQRTLGYKYAEMEPREQQDAILKDAIGLQTTWLEILRQQRNDIATGKREEKPQPYHITHEVTDEQEEGRFPGRGPLRPSDNRDIELYVDATTIQGDPNRYKVGLFGRYGGEYVVDWAGKMPFQDHPGPKNSKNEHTGANLSGIIAVMKKFEGYGGKIQLTSDVSYLTRVLNGQNPEGVLGKDNTALWNLHKGEFFRLKKSITDAGGSINFKTIGNTNKAKDKRGKTQAQKREIEGIDFAHRFAGTHRLPSEWNKVDYSFDVSPAGATNKMLEHMAENLGVAPTEADWNFWRNREIQSIQLSNQPVISATIDYNGKLNVYNLKPEKPMNLAGNMKFIKQEPLSMEDAYSRAYEREGFDPGELRGGAIHQFLDHAVVQDPYTGKTKDVSLLRLKQHFFGQEMRKVGEMDESGYQVTYMDAVVDAEKAFNNFLYGVMDAQWNRKSIRGAPNRMYYFGGRGDAERLYFVKVHPTVARIRTIDGDRLKSVLNEMKKVSRKLGWIPVTEGGKTRDVKLVNIFNAEWALFQTTVNKGKSGEFKKRGNEMFAEAFMSNIMYELDMNGFELNRGIRPSEIKKFYNIIGDKGNDFIDTAKAFNKRAQIWLNTGVSQNKDFIIPALQAEGWNDDVTASGRANVLIINDRKMADKLGVQAKNLEEGTDGALFMTPEYMLATNSDMGLPNEGHSNKSFIVSPNKLKGAMLGKYMIHEADPAMVEWMRREKIHIIAYKSGLKQIGTRKTADAYYKNGAYEFSSGWEKAVHRINMADIKTVITEKTDRHFLEPQRIPKQMQSLLTEFSFNPVKPEVIDDFFNATSRERFLGKSALNEEAENYLLNPTSEGKDYLIKNIDDIGIPTMLKLLKSPKSTKFTVDAYKHMLSKEQELANQEFQEGEIEKAVFDMQNDTRQEYRSAHDTIMALASDESLAASMHKAVKHYRSNVIRNYILGQVTRPKIGNSFISRMRPYTPWMWEQRGKYGATARLNEADGDKIFFLDEGYRELKLKSHIFGGKVSGRLGEMELGEAWESYVDGKFDNFPKLKVELEDVLEAVIMRVPMDSMSGARVLKFAGFTGVDGLGILLHPRVMRALGGADLDGDKAWGFFGGRNEEGAGEGFKNSWKQMYKDQVDEYGPVGTGAKGLIDPETGKPYYESFLDDSDPMVKDRIENPGLRWSPMARMSASLGAAQGRNMLGPAVVNKAVISAAYSELMNRPNKSYSYTFEDYNGEKRNILMTAREKPEDIKRQREMGKVSIHLPADPMDEAGLKDMNSFFSLMADSAFKYTDVTNPKNHIVLSANPKEKGWMGQHAMKRAGLNTHFSKINQVLYGRNWAEERRWTPGEIHSGLTGAYDALHQGEIKGGLYKNLAQVFHGLDWTEGIFFRINEQKLRNLYKDFHKEWEDNRELQEILQRTGRSIWDDKNKKFNRLLEFVITRKLHDERVLSSYLLETDSNEKLLDAFPEYTNKKGFNRKSTRQRERILREMVHKAEDFIVNDLSDMASMRFIRKFIEPIMARENAAGKKVSKERIVLGLHHMVEEIKRQAYFQGIDRKNETGLMGNEFELSATQREFFKLMGLEREVEERESSMLDQFQIDAKVNTLKKNMTDPEKRLFDAFMLGTLRKGTQVEVNKAIEQAKETYISEEKFPPAIVEAIEILRQLGAKTALSNLGFVSSSVSKGMKRAFWAEYESLFDKSVNFFSDKEHKTIKTDALKGEAELEKDNPRSILDENGQVMKGTALEEATFDEKTKTYLEEAHPFNGILSSKAVKGPKFKLKGEAMEIVLSLQEHFRNKFNNMTGRNMNELVRTMFNKNMNEMNLDDWRTMDNILSEIDGGQWWRKVLKYVDDNEYLPSMTPFHHHIFPEATNKDLMRKEIILVAKRGIYKDKHGNVLTGDTAQPTQIGEILQQFINMNKEWATGVHEERKNEISAELSPYLESIEEGPMFWRIAVRRMEQGMTWHLREKYQNDVTWSILKEVYEKPWKDIQKKHDWDELQKKTFQVTTPEGAKNMSGLQIVEKITDVIEKWNKNNMELIRGNEEVIDSYLSMIGRSYHSDSKSKKVWKKAKGFIEDKDNAPNFRVEDPNEETYLNEVFKKTFWWGILENGGKSESEIKKAQREYQKLYNQYRQEKYVANIRGLAAVLDYRNQLKFADGKEDMQASRRKMMMKLFKDILESNDKGKPFHTKLGIDGLRIISREIMLAQIPDAKDREEIANSMSVHTTGEYPSRIYFPHLMFDRNIAQAQMERALELIMADPSKEIKDKNREMDRIIFHTRQMTGDWIPQTDVSDQWNALNDGLQRIGEKKKNRIPREHMNWFKTHRRAGNQYSRNSHIPGWNIEFEAYTQYMKNLTDVHYQLISQLMSRTSMLRWKKRMADRFEHPDTHKVKKEDQQLINRWENFFNLYISQSMGLPSQIPEHILEDPGMHIKGTPYAWFADSEVKKRLNKIAEKLGLDKNIIKEKFPEVAQEYPEMAEKFDFADLQRFSALEAKYELAALLAHPKSSVTNLFGGTVNTLISTGWEHFRNARDIEYLQKNVNPKFTKRQDWEDWVIKLGVVEEFLLYEAGINPKFKSGKWKNFFEDAFAKINKDPNMEDATLTSLAKSHGITESVFSKAAWFMRRPERTLRRDAFLAHYLQAREKFGGAFQKFDNPILIQMAKKGVKGTQFLYSAPFRPPFSASAAGKVFTRFQTWAWNSVRFRREIIEDADARGWREGSVEFDRFKRMATADLFMLGMANIFLYSIFDNALPAPWNWIQDTADSLYGDEKERERAFFGHPLGPVQIITPPVLRLLPELFKAMIEDDYTKLAGYTIPSYFPFGRMGRDVFGPGGLYENPYRGVEKITGFPYMQAAREFKSYREDKGMYPKGLLDLIYQPFEREEEPSD